MAYIRVFSDLIMADNVIDAGEMSYFADLRSAYRFSRREEIEAKSMTLSEAVNILRNSDEDIRRELVSKCKELSLSDGFCAGSEALLIMAVIRSIDSCLSETNRIHSYPGHLFNIPVSCMIYIESEPSGLIDGIVESNYRSLYSEFRLGGFEFIHIPHVIQHYRESDAGLVDSIIAFVAPELSEAGRAASVDKLLKMTTSEFTKDILCNKLGMDSLRVTAPALFLKTGISYVGDTVYANYLKIDVDADLLRDARAFLDEYTMMLSSDVMVVSNNREQRNQFLYSGFYKLLLDTHLMRRHVRSRVFINPFKEEIFFPDIDTVLHGLHRREKALYMTMLLLSRNGGADFTPPDTSGQMAAYKRRMDRIQNLYAYIYGMFGGERAKAPDLTSSDIRRPMLSLIKRQLSKLSDRLYNIGDYMISKDEFNTMFIHLENESVFIRDHRTGDMLSLDQWSRGLAMLQP